MNIRGTLSEVCRGGILAEDSTLGFIQLNGRLILRILVLCSVLIDLPNTRAGDSSPDVRTIITSAADALKRIEHPAGGRGGAVLTIDDFDGSHKHFVEFRFKDALSRTDRFRFQNGTRGERDHVWSMGRDVCVTYNRRNAVVQGTPASVFYEQFGFDFRPHSITHLSQLTWTLQNIAKDPSVRAERDDKGLLTITREYSGPKVTTSLTMVLDRDQGFRPVLYDYAWAAADDPQKHGRTRQQWSWKQYAHAWYVNKATLERPDSLLMSDGTTRGYRVEFVVEDFAPNVPIDDSEFTLPALHLPEGVPIVDHIAGITYRQGTRVMSTDESTKVLPDAESPKRLMDDAQQRDNRKEAGHLDPNDASSERGASGKAMDSTVSLESVRQKVQANEAKTRLIRMKYRVYPENSADISRIRDSRRSNRAYTYLLQSYAQDGPRFHLTQSSYSETERAFTRSTVQVVDGEVRKSGVLPDLMEGYITPIEKFAWGGPGPVQASFRPFQDWFLLSECLLSKYASVHQDHDTIHGRDAAVVDVKHPVQERWSLRIWIDRERGLPLRVESHWINQDASESDPPSFEEPAKFHQLPNGGWLAVEGASTLIRIHEGREARLCNRWIVDVNSISIEKKDIPDSLFDIQFPPGARIQNHLGRK